MKTRRLNWKLVLVLWLAMMALRQDFWFWRDARLVLGFVPVGLAYQGGYSILSALLMWGLVRRYWPVELERLEHSPPRSETEALR